MHTHLYPIFCGYVVTLTTASLIMCQSYVLDVVEILGIIQRSPDLSDHTTSKDNPPRSKVGQYEADFGEDTHIVSACSTVISLALTLQPEPRR